MIHGLPWRAVMENCKMSFKNNVSADLQFLKSKWEAAVSEKSDHSFL